MTDDTISRSAAIKALNTEIIKRRLLDDVNDGMLDEFDTESILRRLPSAQLAQDLPKGCTDTISRQAAIEAVRKAKDKSEAHRMLVQLPPAQLGCEDAVSRADVDILIEEAQTAWLRGDILLMYPALKKGLQKVPPVTPKQPGWIPCSERLPERYDNYLITTEDGMVVFGVYDPREKQWCRYDSIKSLWLYGIKALAWQPLPTPYREGGQNDGKN